MCLKMIISFLVSWLCLIKLSRSESDYANHHLYRIALETTQHTQIIQQMKEYSIVDRYDPLTNELDLIVSPHNVPYLNDLLQKKRIKREILHDDIQKKIIEENEYVRPANTSGNEFGWKNYYHIETIYAWLDHLAEKYADVITVLDAGKSYEGVPLKGVKLSYNSGNKLVFIESGIHGRERIAPTTATFILNELLTSTDQEVRYIAENFDWIIFPSINPDGYKYTFNGDRLWRKTRTPYGNCFGADLNRNWQFKWGETLDPDPEPCGINYPGPYEFSERESQQMSTFLKTQHIHVYISLHSAAQLILFPYAASDEKPYNFGALNSIAEKAAAAISKRYKTVFRYGNAASTIYPASGTSMDYVYNKLEVPFVFTFELRRDHIQILPGNEIIPTGLETLDAFVALLKEMRVQESFSLLNLAYWLLGGTAIIALFALTYYIFIRRKKAKAAANYTTFQLNESSEMSV